jgi:HK97 family phage major capsid protein
MHALELRQDRAKLIREAGEIVKKCQTENRGLTVAEDERWKKLHADADRVLATAEAIETQERKEKELAGNILSARDRADGFERTAEGRIDVENHALAPATSVRSWLGARGELPEQDPELTFGKVVSALARGAKTEAEKRALSEGTDSAGGYSVPVGLSASLIDRMRAATTVIRAGAKTIPLNEGWKQGYARTATGATVGWISESGTITAADPTFELVQFVPRTLVALVKCSREVVEDSINLGNALEIEFAGAMAVELDRVALLGTGTPPEPRGIKNTSGVGSVQMVIGGATGATLAASGGFDKLIDLQQTIADANGPEATGLIVNPRTAAQLSKLKESSTAAYLTPPAALANIPRYSTTILPGTETQGSSSGVCSRAIMGHFPYLWLGIRTSVRVELLRERFADNFQYGFLAYLRADVAIAQPPAFAQLLGII